MKTRPFLRLVLLATLASLATTSSALAQGKAAFNVAILAIRASSDNAEVSPELKPIADQLRKKYKFTGYRLERQATERVAANQDVSKPLPADYTAKVTPLAGDEKSVELKVEIWRKVAGKDELRVNTKIKVDRGKYAFLGGWKFEENGEDVLIVAISAK